MTGSLLPAAFAPPTVASTKRAFIEAYSRPIPSIYNTVVQELLVQQHFIRYSVNYAYNPVRRGNCCVRDVNNITIVARTDFAMRPALHWKWPLAGMAPHVARKLLCCSVGAPSDLSLEGVTSDSLPHSFASPQLYALGFVSVFDQILDGHDATERAAIFDAYVRALDEDPACYRVRCVCVHVCVSNRAGFAAAIPGDASGCAG
jgi:Thylakoid formation protein